MSKKAKKQPNLRPHSAVMLDGPDRAPSRAMLYPTGFKTGDFDKPIVGVASTWSNVTPCNMHIDLLAQEAERAANARAADAAADEERSRRVDEGPVDIGAAMTNAALRESLPGAAAKMEKKVEARVAPKDEATRDAPAAADAACGCAVA